MAPADRVLNVWQRRMAEALLGLVALTTAGAALPLAWQARRLASGWIETTERAWSFYGKIREGRMMAMPGQNPWQSTAVRLTVGFALSRCLGRVHLPLRWKASSAASAGYGASPALESFCRGIVAPRTVPGDCAATAGERRIRERDFVERVLGPWQMGNAVGPPESPLVLGPPLVVT